MKKASCIILTVIFALTVFVACGPSPKPAPEISNDAAKDTEAPMETVSVELTASDEPGLTEAPTPTEFTVPEEHTPASDETIALADSCVCILIEHRSTFDPSLGRPADEVYASLKRGYPEFQALEDAPDSHEALLELYEEYADALTEEAYADMLRSGEEDKPAEGRSWADEHPEGYALWARPLILEALLSRPEYFARFDNGSRARFIAAFVKANDIISAANIEHYGSDSFFTPRFIELGGEKLLGMRLVKENGVWHAK